MIVVVRIDAHPGAKVVDRFHRDPGCRAALVSVTAGGVGLDLSCASVVVGWLVGWLVGWCELCVRLDAWLERRVLFQTVKGVNLKMVSNS